MKKMKLITACIFATTLNISLVASAAETVPEKIENTADKAGKSVKKTFRGAKDKGCEMINGKMECLGKKAKHKVQDAGDSVESKADEVKNKID